MVDFICVQLSRCEDGKASEYFTIIKILAHSWIRTYAKQSLRFEGKCLIYTTTGSDKQHRLKPNVIFTYVILYIDYADCCFVV